MKKIVLLSLIFFTLIANSCKKSLDVNSSRVVNEVNYWNTLEDARAGIMGVYGLTRAALADNNGHWIYGDVRMGSFTSPIRQDLKAVINNDLNAAYPVVNQLSNWRRFYAVINAANTFIERVGEVRKKDPRYTANNMQVDIAQVRFLRAFTYFYISRIWGDVPLILTSRDGSFENRARTSQGAVLAYAQSEMEAAALELPYNYSVNDLQQPGQYYNQSAGRWGGALITKLGAYAMAAQVAAWQGKYADVIKYTRLVMTEFVTRNPSLAGNGQGTSPYNSGYTSSPTLTDPAGLFYKQAGVANPAQLFGLGFVWDNQDAAFTGNIESLALASPVVNKSVPDIYVSKDSILSIFREPNDARFVIDTTGVTYLNDRYFANFNGRYPVFQKIKVLMGGEKETNAPFRIFSSSILLTRFEEVTLLRAEAYAVLGETQLAINDLNAVRKWRYNVDQVGLRNNDQNDFVPYSFARHGSIIEAIFKERQKEFMGEGQRWYDRIRYEKIKQNNPQFMQMISNGAIYWPIAKEIIAQNPLITQNSFWK